MTRMPLFFALILALGCGCQMIPEVPEMEPKQAYQRIANALPGLNIGVAEPPSVIFMTRSKKVPDRPVPRDLKVAATDRGFKIRIDTMVPRTYQVPYSAITFVDAIYEPMPNVFFAPLLLIVQTWKLRVVIDMTQVNGLSRQIKSDIQTLEALSREVGIAQPYYYAESLRDRLFECRERWGPNEIELVTSKTSIGPPLFPSPYKVRELAAAFAWAQKNAKGK